MTLALSWPVILELQRYRELAVVMSLIPAAFQLVIPLATLFLVHRTVEPTARARFRA